MIDPNELELAFQEYIKGHKKWVPDGLQEINIHLLHHLGLLTEKEFEKSAPHDFEQYFHVIESPEKVTLYNDQFAVWIVPKHGEEMPSTTTLIALMNKGKPLLETGFLASGVYNTPKYILRVLQHMIAEVIDTEAVISQLESSVKKDPDKPINGEQNAS